MNKLILLFLLLGLYGCFEKDSHIEILDQADSLIDHNPDSVYHLLLPIHLANIKGEQSRARFALLYSKALEKQQIRIKSDSLTSVAYDYYKNHGSNYEKAMTYLYASRVDWYCANIADAMKKLTYAEELVPQDSLYLKGLIVGGIALCYSSQLNFKKAIEYYEYEYSLFSQLGVKHNQGSIRYNQAHEYSLMKDFDKAIEICQESKEIYHELCDTANMLRCDIAITKYSVYKDRNFELAKRNFLNIREQYKEFPVTRNEYDLLADLYRFNDRDSSAYYQTLSLSMCDTTTTKGLSVYFVRSAEIAATVENYEAAYWQIRKANRYLKENYSNHLNNEVADLNLKYREEIQKRKEERLENVKNNIVYISFVLLSFVLFLIYAIVQGYRNRLRRLDDELNLAHELANTVANTQDIMSSVDNVAGLDNINFITTKLNILIEKMPMYENRPRIFINEFLTVMKSQIQPRCFKTVFCDIIENNYPGILNKIGSKYGLSHAEIEVLCMLAFGVSNTAIQNLMDYTNSRTVYNTRSSIKSKLNININSSKSIFTWLNAESIS